MMMTSVCHAVLLGAVAASVTATAAGGGGSKAKCTANTTAAEIVAGFDLSGKTVVISGGDSGIGFETALALASANASIIIGSLGHAAGAAAAANISASTGNRKVIDIPLDLSSFASVRSFAAEVKQKAISGVARLILDAGIAVNPTGLPPITDDGFERVFQVNFLGHVLLAELLAPELRRATGRLIHVSSEASFDPCLWGNRQKGCIGSTAELNASLHKLVTSETPQGTNPLGAPSSNYGLSKWAQVWHAAEFARREHNYGPPAGHVTAYSLHPGFVATPMTKILSPATMKLWCANEKPCPLTPSEGATVPTWLAAGDVGEIVPLDGQFIIFCAAAESVIDEYRSKAGDGQTLAFQESLFNVAVEMCGAARMM